MSIVRDKTGSLSAIDNDEAAFSDEKNRFENDFSVSNSIFYCNQLYCYMPDQLDIYDCNNTKYVVSNYSSDITLANYSPKNIKECISLVKKVAFVVEKIHNQGYLFLDIKPGNVLVIDDFDQYIKLLDFDSLVAMCDIEKSNTKDNVQVRLSFSKGFAPLELETGKLKKLGPHTDVYGIGALLYWMLFGETPSAKATETDTLYDFDKIAYRHDNCDMKLFYELSNFFHLSLASFYLDRYQSMADVLDKLQTIEKLADPLVPRIISSTVNGSQNLIGRTYELQKLDSFVQFKCQNCLFITGMAGIGKSSLIRHYLAVHKCDFDTILYMNYDTDMKRTISDDSNVKITTLSQFEYKKLSDNDEVSYFDKKLQLIKRLTEDKKAIIVIDNFNGEIDEATRKVLQIGCKVVLVSRQAFVMQDVEILHLEAIEDKSALHKIFETNLGRHVENKEIADLNSIIKAISGHTLILELIAKLVASSYLNVADALELIENKGFSRIGKEKILFLRDGLSHTESLIDIIEMLFQTDSLIPIKKFILKVMSLFTVNGIDVYLLRRCLQLDSFDEINKLARDGWLLIVKNNVSMHPVIQEAVRQWGWNEEMHKVVDEFMHNLDEMISHEANIANIPKKIYLQTHDANDKADIRPVDWDMLLYYLQIAEQIISMSKYDKKLQGFQSFSDLCVTTILYLPRTYEESIFVKTNFLLTIQQPRIRQIEEGKFWPADLKFILSILRVYQTLVDIYVDKHDLDAIEDILDSAKKLAWYSNNDFAYALYHDIKSEYYDLCLNGAYDAETSEEKNLLDKLLESIEQTLKHSKEFASKDIQCIYVNNLLSKAIVLIRSCRSSAEDINCLLEQAASYVFDNFLTFADVRLTYYMVCAWFYALVFEDEKLTDKYIMLALRLAKIISATDLDIIDNNLIPCANIYYEIQNPQSALNMLDEGINICAEHANTEVYDRKKQELADHYVEICLDFKKHDILQDFINRIDAENQNIVDPEMQISISEELRNSLEF